MKLIKFQIVNEQKKRTIYVKSYFKIRTPRTVPSTKLGVIFKMPLRSTSRVIDVLSFDKRTNLNDDKM